MTVLKDLLLFDSMLTPKIITFVYWLILLAAVLSGIRVMALPYYGGFIQGIAAMIVIAVTARIWCELLIVLFKIYENVRKIAGTPAAPASPARDEVVAPHRQPAE